MRFGDGYCLGARGGLDIAGAAVAGREGLATTAGAGSLRIASGIFQRDRGHHFRGIAAATQQPGHRRERRGGMGEEQFEAGAQVVLPLLAIARAREASVTLPIIARARDASHAALLYKAGASTAVPETLESSLQLSEAVLVDLGVAMGPVIASIHEKRDEFRRAIKEAGELDEAPRLKLRSRLNQPAQP